MQPNENNASLEALQEIRSIMDKSARFVSLSGMSGIWAGAVGLVGAYIASNWLRKPEYMNIGKATEGSIDSFDSVTMRLMWLGVAVFVVAIAGAFYFTYRKAKKHNQSIFNNASRQMVMSAFFPLLAGGVFCVSFIYNGCGMFVGPACLVFYGLALISGSRHTLSDIRYLGMLNVALGCCNLFYPGFGLYFWAAGFGLLNLLYGAMMWSKYDK